jgi:hypothetical protein
MLHGEENVGEGDPSPTIQNTSTDRDVATMSVDLLAVLLTDRTFYDSLTVPHLSEATRRVEGRSAPLANKDLALVNTVAAGAKRRAQIEVDRLREAILAHVVYEINKKKAVMIGTAVAATPAANDKVQISFT